jgi:hypothetical protein
VVLPSWQTRKENFSEEGTQELHEAALNKRKL